MNELAESAAGAGLIAFHVLASVPLRRWRTTWGATQAEVNETLPGDDSVPHPAWGYTHAIDVDTTPDLVWPWLTQIGQQRAGFYSYRGLENMVGCNITAATGLDPWFQTLAVGDSVILHPQAPSLTVTVVDDGTALVLLGADPESADRALWSFHLRPLPGGRTRLIERGRYSHSTSFKSNLTFGRYFVEPIGFVMSRKMLRTIAANAIAAQAI
ncbi:MULTISPECIES: SRPBCC family protein [unclassified Rhodococcus (in: high G+C Gram-positive bacteria)]|uniref:SRPBCC family protein n=1 Tax=unclassified Rhodococcus (in: high G+C Gram-positive bacteria) TaxID=192944 RepID=UPI00295483B2|nr:SRPBCC family protein [Rhodococcus sp. IEGM 1343]MDV8056284.1 SRPBCC family protein [Rhodococcus sp. IEGM 1343]